MCLCVTIPLVTNWKKHEIGVRPTLEDMKRNLDRFATLRNGRFAGTDEKPRGLVETELTREGSPP